MEFFRDIARLLIPLIIIMDPFGNLPFFLMFTASKPVKERNRIAAVSTSTAALILLFFALTGNLVLNFFHISLAAFQLAGGFIFFIYSLQMLALIPSGLKTSDEEEHEAISKDSVALVPLATPFLAGPGAITAVLVWRDQAGTWPTDKPLTWSRRHQGANKVDGTTPLSHCRPVHSRGPAPNLLAVAPQLTSNRAFLILISLPKHGVIKGD